MPKPRKETENVELMTMYLKEKIMADYSNTGNYTATARRMNLSVQVVKNVVTKMRDDYNEIREEMKHNMIQELWGNLIDAQRLGHQYIKEALDGKREIPLNHVSNYFSVMYDKQALLAGENTQNVGGNGIQVVLNMPDVEEEDVWANRSL